MSVTWLIRVFDITRIHICDKTRSYVWCNSSIRVKWLVYPTSVALAYVTPSCVWYDSFIRVTWLIHMCDMTHSYLWHDSFIFVTWLIHMWDMTHVMWHDSFDSSAGPTLWRTCDMTHSRVWHDWFIFVTWNIHKWDMTPSYLWSDSFVSLFFV